MKYEEKLEYLQENYLMAFVRTREEVFNEFSEQQTMFCCCGKLATGNHEMNCKKFNRRVNNETIERLSDLIPKGGKQ